MKSKRLIAAACAAMFVPSLFTGCGKEPEIYETEHTCEETTIKHIDTFMFKPGTSYKKVAKTINGFCMFMFDEESDQDTYAAEVKVHWDDSTGNFLFFFNADKEFVAWMAYDFDVDRITLYNQCKDDLGVPSWIESQEVDDNLLKKAEEAFNTSNKTPEGGDIWDYSTWNNTMSNTYNKFEWDTNYTKENDANHPYVLTYSKIGNTLAYETEYREKK